MTMIAISRIHRGMMLLSASILFFFSAAAFAQTTLESIKQEDLIKLGVANEAPFGYMTEDGKLSGEAPAIARKILEKIDPEIKVEGVVTEFGELIDELQAGRFDVIAAGMFITPDRCEEVAFSHPTYKVGEAFLVKEGNPKNLTDFASIANNPDARLAVMAGAVEYEYAYEAGVFVDQVKVLLNYQEAIAELEAGHIDAIAMTYLTARDLAEKHPDLQATAQFFPVIDGEPVAGYGAFAFRKEDEALHAAFNQYLEDFIGSDEHWKIVQEFGLTPEMIPDKTVETLCKG